MHLVGAQGCTLYIVPTKLEAAVEAEQAAMLYLWSIDYIVMIRIMNNSFSAFLLTWRPSRHVVLTRICCQLTNFL